MSDRYPGGLIRKTPPTIDPPVGGEGGSAPGIWTTDQVAYYEKEGLWPKPVLPRELYTWGEGTGFVTGQATSANTSSPVQIGTAVNWARGPQTADAANVHGLAISDTGGLWAWGSNTYGQIGDNTTAIKVSPMQIGALTNWAKVSCGFLVSSAIKTDGTLWMWGINNYGYLGQNDTVDYSSPVQVGADTDWYSVGVSTNILAVKTNGTLWAWGGNNAGGLGLNNTINRSSPVQVGALTNWLKIQAAGNTSLAIKTDGTLWSWGNNGEQQLAQGLNDTINRSSPVQVGSLTTWSDVSIKDDTAFALKTDGTLWGWGDNGFGAVGTGTTLVTNYGNPAQIGSDTDWYKIGSRQAGGSAIKTDGTLWIWGLGDDGQLGNDTDGRISSPIQVGSDTNWDAPALGSTDWVVARTKG